MFDNVRMLLVDILQIHDRIESLDESTPLLGNIPEFDSMAVVTVITALEDQFGFFVEDDEISAETFETLGSLVAFVESKVGT